MNPNVDNQFLPYLSTDYSRKQLTKHYEQAGVPSPEKMSYATCNSFISYLKQGNIYYSQAEIAPLEIKPLLLFYGFIQYLKAAILTKDPTYPATTQVLAHGVTTRKRKKTTYRFLEDEVKLQRNGLFPHFLAKLFHMKHVEGDKYLMKELVSQIADLHTLYQQLHDTPLSIQLKLEKHSLLIPNLILDQYHMTANRFSQYVENHLNLKKPLSLTETKDGLSFSAQPLKTKSRTPFLKDQHEKMYIHLNKDHYIHLPEIACHYLLLYNLSMICRYETEWWTDLITNNDGTDFPIILKFLQILPIKTSQLISELLLV
ncbi:YaaC family protein [Alkalihalobacillus pseudalcaliphilus]|uniref:YaaC family protein n=1 Tax=Alkalihalobacillus pseudalcaliphilus TaxID=79884 RepID=UPI00064D7EDE|nr:YaaC family protein [Alkalihalobacillus pseudalcaliphilus]KMK74456.1 hypothetical protein AB990_20630 [Alkalihalobacillus pseudalcaliphilus]